MPSMPALLAALLLGLASSSPGPTASSGPKPLRGPSDAPAPAARILTITALDYAFQAPASVPAGLTTIRLVNRGTQLHHVQLNKLAEGATLSAMLKAWRPGEPVPSLMRGAGGPTAAMRGQTLEGQVVLTPGTYAIICWVPAPDGQLHMQKGMMRTLTVTPDPAAPAALPAPDLTIGLVDYAYDVPPIARGRRSVRIENRGPQSHEVVMVRLFEGHTAQDAVAWAEHGQTDAAPGVMVGGMAALAPGEAGQFSVEFVPGRYALLCFTPDQKDHVGRPHTAYGMVREVVVK